MDQRHVVFTASSFPLSVIAMQAVMSKNANAFLNDSLATMCIVELVVNSSYSWSTDMPGACLSGVTLPGTDFA